VATKVSFLNSSGRRPSERELAIWLLRGIAITCALIWTRGLFLALTAGPGQQVDVPDPASWGDLSRAALRDPFHALSLVLGAARAHRLEAWASSSFFLGVIAEAAIFLSLYLRKKGRRPLLRGS
jgi:hypothetical protein